ncbi:hypothetical protein [Micromonospora sp. NPDC092111]|uniref:hypothetical protein n=1 Tax=Micromonospora sp. NPDC092111 TaxID=3364289 RepID=UPI00382F649F
MLDPAEPQLVVDSRTLHFSWLPADPDAVAALVPAGLRPRSDRQVFMNQYVVEDDAQTSGFGAYSLTYVGVTLSGADAPDGVTPGGWWTHYVTSSHRVRDYAVARGAPAVLGRTTIAIRGDSLVAETEADGVALIRARARVGHTGHAVRTGHNRYFTLRDGKLLSAVYPFVAEPVTPFEIESVEFLDPTHPIYALRPENPLLIGWGFYAPRTSFAYPGGLTPYPASTPAAPDGPGAHRVESTRPGAPESPRQRSATSAPARPDPARLDPARLDPVSPDPVSPDPASPDPVSPDPASPDPASPDPASPDPASPDPASPDPGLPGSGVPEPARPGRVPPPPVPGVGPENHQVPFRRARSGLPSGS